MVTINLNNLEKAYGDRVLFSGVTLQLMSGSRYGLVGANGSGKTTLLNILAGDDFASDGELNIPKSVTLGVLRQDRYLSDSQRIIDVAMMGDRPAWEALQEKERLLAEEAPDAHAIAVVEDRIAHTDGYTLQARAATVLEGLGIPVPRHEGALSTLSGGFKLRVLLAQTLISNPDLLLLDEPTNHLDILTIDWLEQFLLKYEGCAVVISHDHRFLDQLATHILDVDYETVESYPGNYSAFLQRKRQTRELKEAEIERNQAQVAQKKAFIERFRYKATKARQAQSRLKQIEKIENEIGELATSSRRAPMFRFEQARHSGREVLSLDDVHKSYGDNHVLSGVSFSVRRGERIGIIGANGIGKSTLLKIIMDELDPDSGESTWGYEASAGYFAQDHHEMLGDEPLTVLDYLWRTCPQETTSFVRGHLGRMLFSGDDVEKKTRALSGGEAARLIFSELIVRKPNVLVLDEPTNHLDLETIEALADALDQYEGTIIFVSHDRWFVGRLATRIIELTAKGLDDYPGNYAEYLTREGADHLNAKAVVQQARDERGEAKAGETGGDWRQQKQRRAERRKLANERDKVTEAVDKSEARLAEIEALYCKPDFYAQTPSKELQALDDETAALKAQVERDMARWEDLETELEAFPEE